MAPQNRDGGFQELPRTGGWDVPFARPPPFPRATVPAAAAGQQRCAWEEATHRAAADHGSPGPLTRTGTSAGLPALGLLTKREKKTPIKLEPLYWESLILAGKSHPN